MSKLHPGLHVTPTIKLVRLLGEGGMGSVWVAEHLALGTEVAVKFIAPWFVDNEQSVVRFREEAQKMARVKSPHVTTVFDYGIMLDGQPYIVMELLAGETLQQRLEREGPLPIDAVVRLVEQTAMGLEAAHRFGVVHRDIKPANLFLIDVGSQPFVKVLDFGIAKWFESDMSITGDPIGTPLYMSPEQLQDPKSVDHCTDLWSLGVVAYEAFTGRLPFQGATVYMIARAICDGVFGPPSVNRQDLPEAVDVWMTQALARDIEARFSSSITMADALSAAFKRIVIVPEDFGTAVTPLVPEFPLEPPRRVLQIMRASPFSFIGNLADKALAMGRAEEAERILQRSLDQLLDQAHNNQLPTLDVVSTAAHYASKLASATGKGRWINYIFALYSRIDQIMPNTVVDEIYQAAGKVKEVDMGLLRAYTQALRARSSYFGPSGLSVLERIESLESVGWRDELKLS